MENRNRMRHDRPYRSPPVYINPYGYRGGGLYDYQPYGRGPHEFYPYNGAFPPVPAGQ